METAGHEDEYYIRSTSQNVIHQRVSIKHGDSFVVTDRRGDLPVQAGVETGFYVGGTRYLSALELRVDGEKPLLLSSSLSDDDVHLIAVQTNGDVVREGEVVVPKDAVLFARETTVLDGRFFVRIEVRSYHVEPIELALELRAGADFADIFEVRGYERKARGEILGIEGRRDAAQITYRGLDDVIRRTAIRFSPTPDELGDLAGVPGAQLRALYRLVLRPHETRIFEIAVAGGFASTVEAPAPDARKAVAKVRREHASWDKETTRFFTSNDSLNAILERASADLRLMCTKTTDGLVPYAGIPWYSCPFGRDSLWTSLMALPLQPRIASGTLRYLARRQAEERDDFVDSEPGKILHEMRTGEMANLREIPFIPYYGSVDSTPLFVVLLDRYHRWTGDEDLVGQLWVNARAALDWIERHGDLDGDLLVEYACRSPLGLRNQGWKDSSDSVFHRDGRLAEGPIALVEAQAYAWAAQRAGARLAKLQGEEEYARHLEERAAELKERFEGAFWSEELGTYVIALDGAKEPCEIVTSNAGHALWAGIADEERAARVAKTLLSPAMFSGWGVRTLAEGEARYNPISYHDGSVWPHDNAILAHGLKRYGHRDAAARIATAILDASQMFDDNRLPELFCGFARTPRHAPTPYPVACRPQAWSAATIFALLEAMLGMEVDGKGERLVFMRPALPAWLEWIEMTNLLVGTRRVSVRLKRSPKGGGVVVRSSGDAKVQVRR